MKKTFKTNGRLLSQVFSSYKDTFIALCELINNSIQAKASKIEIQMDFSDDMSPDPFTEYRIIDDGEGVTASEFDYKILVIYTFFYLFLYFLLPTQSIPRKKIPTNQTNYFIFQHLFICPYIL